MALRKRSAIRRLLNHLTSTQLKHFDLDELPCELSVLRDAEEVALLLRAVMVGEFERAAAVRRESYVAHVTLGEGVQVAAERGDQTMFREAVQHRAGVQRPIPCLWPQRKMCEDEVKMMCEEDV